MRQSWLSLRAEPSGLAVTGVVAGCLLLLAMAMVLTRELLLPFPEWVAGVPLWLAALLLIPRLKQAQRKQIGILVAVGVSGLLFAVGFDVLSSGNASVEPGQFPADNQTTPYFLKAVAGNQMLLAMLVGVSFLRLVALAGIAPAEDLPKGRTVLQKTMISTHILGSVLNMSAPMIVGDRLVHANGGQPLLRPQGMVLLRAFSTAAFWSPFFGAMGLTLLSAPGSQLVVLVACSLPVAMAGLLFTAWEIHRKPELDQVQGFPLSWSSLGMPVGLALLVVICHWIWPAVSVLTLVTLLAVSVTVLWRFTLGKKRDKQGIPVCQPNALVNHVKTGLPGLCSEVSLFLGAAVLASGVAATLAVLDLSLAPQHYGALEACITLMVLVGVAMLGMHPVTTVALAGSILAPSVSDPNLLGLTMLMCWGIGSGFSPMSGIQLTMQARFGMRAREILWANRFYGPFMFAVCFAVLFAYQWISG